MLFSFVATGILLTISVGAFMGLMFTSEMRGKVRRSVTAIVIALLFGFGISGLICLEHQADVDTWNNGYCECGGEWELFDVERVKNGSDLYFYKCPDCKDAIRLHSEFQ